MTLLIAFTRLQPLAFLRAVERSFERASASLLLALLPATFAVPALSLLLTEQAFAQAAAAAAPAAARAEIKLVAYRIVSSPSPTGVRETREPLKTLSPGDLIEYEATYFNRSAQAMRDVSMTVPVPAGGLAYIAAQKAPLASSASTDGKVFAALPLTRDAVAAGGKHITQPVPLADYRVLRWNLGDLPAGASRSTRVRMQMDATASAADVLAALAPTSAGR